MIFNNEKELRKCAGIILKYGYGRTKLTREDRFRSIFLNKEDYYVLKASAESMNVPMSSALPMLMHLGLLIHAEVMSVADRYAKK